MKGIVFTEFMEMVEQRFSPEIADAIVTMSPLSSGGSYTAVATYDHRELLTLVGNLAKTTGLAAGDLVTEFGRYLFGRFVQLFPALFDGIDCPAEFLRRVESYIHVEVRKLYPDTELPSFQYRNLGSHGMELCYRSARPFADLAEGLIRGCCEHYGVAVQISRKRLPADPQEGVQFCLTFTEMPTASV
jgi:hypothetical protein